jgi:Ni,Fe-hydrogenase I large subunit
MPAEQTFTKELLMMKKRIVTMLTASLLALSLGGMAIAEETTLAPTDKTTAPKVKRKRTAVTKERTTTVTATVQALDLAKRVATLKGPKGELFDVKVGPQAKNLAQVKVGDEVVITYYESVAYRLLKPGEAAVPTTQTDVVGTAPKGEKPAGIAGSQTTLTATILALDPKAQTATLKGPEGKIVTVKVKDPKNMEAVKVGDEVAITYTEALAISVEKPPKK